MTRVLYGQPSVAPIVSAAWLQERLDEVTVVDVRWSMDGSDPQAAYREAHLPGAIWVSLDRDLAAPASVAQGRHPLPDPRDFASAMARVGIKQSATVVAYDQGAGGYAARLVWMLRVTGHDAALLDGGLAGWPGPLDHGEVARPPSDFEVRPWPAEWLSDLDDVGERAGDAASVVVDSRARERYLGEVEPIDARAGHVPGAINLPFMENLDSDGHFLPSSALLRRFRAAGVDRSEDVVVYCGSGVTACHNLLAMESAGIQARLYPGSWSQWSGRDDLPVAIGDEDPSD